MDLNSYFQRDTDYLMVAILVLESIQGYRVYKIVECLKGLDCITFKGVKELAVPIGST